MSRLVSPLGINKFKYHAIGRSAPFPPGPFGCRKEHLCENGGEDGSTENVAQLRGNGIGRRTGERQEKVLGIVEWRMLERSIPQRAGEGDDGVGEGEGGKGMSFLLIC